MHSSLTPFIRPNKISVFWVTGLEILGRVGTHILKKEKKIWIFFFFFMHLKGEMQKSRFR